MSTLDCTYLDMNTAQRAYVDLEPIHSTSTESHYKSQNPSPKHNSCHTYHYEISPLSTPIGYQQGSETEDMDTTSASSIDGYENILISKQVSRDSRQSTEDIIDTDDDGCDNKNEKNKNYSFNDKDMQLIIMEAQLHDLNEKVLDLMTIIKDLKDRNKYLITSKFELVNNTSDAMNKYRNTINKLNKQNTILLTKINKT
eukprot:UN03124